jgi:catechol 2,3-dioxygenase-like lactoylglutathione lyase family enzyme
MMLSIVRKPNRKFHVNPRVRAYGKARLDIASRVQSPSDWEKLWKRPAYAFPFVWGEYWKQCIEYKVDDFAAEVGFYTDILGLAVNALDPGYAMFTSPARDFYIAIIPTPEGVKSTPPDAIRIQFMLADVFAVAGELERRGITLEQWPRPCTDGSSLYVGYFRTPHGICVDLWGQVDEQNPPNQESSGYSPEDSEPEILEVTDEIGKDEPGLTVQDSPQVENNPDLPEPISEERQDTFIEPEEMLEVEYVDEENI